MVAVTPGQTDRDHVATRPTRSTAAASRIALQALMLRDLVVLRKHSAEFVVRMLVQPFLLCFVFLFVFPKIGTAVGGGQGGPAAESGFATVLVAGVVGISIMFQGVQSVALQMATEFGYTREIEDRVQAPCPIWLVAISKVLSGTIQGLISAAIVLPITFLGGTYYAWTRLAPVTVDGWHWLQTIVLVNPLIYVNEGMRAAFTDAPHMHLYVVYPVIMLFGAGFLALGLTYFRKRVLS